MTSPQSTPFGAWPNAKAFYSNERPLAISSNLADLLQYANNLHPKAQNLFFATTWLSDPNNLDTRAFWVPRLMGNVKKGLRDINQRQADRYSAARRKASFKIPYYDDKREVGFYDLDGVPAVTTLEGCNIEVLKSFYYNDLPPIRPDGSVIESYELLEATARVVEEPDTVTIPAEEPGRVVDSLELVLNVSPETAVALRDTFAAIMDGKKVTIQTSSSVS